VLAHCQRNDVLLTAYSPLKGGVLNDPTVRQIARQRAATPAQVALSWLIRQEKVITIPKSADKKHLEENMRALELELSDEEMEQLNRMA
jgi:diketogulonate reductase-like aldo/keto reductase